MAAMGPGGEFIVVEHLEGMRTLQTEIQGEIRELKERVDTLETKLNKGVAAYDLQAKMWRTFVSFVSLLTPMLVSFVWEHKMRVKTHTVLGLHPSLQYSPAQEFHDNIMQILMAFSVCVGIPLFIFHLFEYLEAKDILPGTSSQIQNQAQNQVEEAADDSDDEGIDLSEPSDVEESPRADEPDQ